MNNYVLLADAWIHGRAWIVFPGDWIDAVPYHGRAYIVEAPLPGLLMVPFVMLYGTAASQTLVASLVASIGCGALWAIASRLGFSRRECVLFVLFFLLGTSYGWAGLRGDVWFFAHVCGAAFTLLAINELLGRARSEYAILWACCAALSRYTLMPAVLLIFVYLIVTAKPQARIRVCLEAAYVGIPALLLYLWYNEARWGRPNDISQWYFLHVMARRPGSPFLLSNVPNQLKAFFYKPPDFEPSFPWIRPSQFGLAITYTSWPLIAAVRARRPVPLVVLLWCATAFALIPDLLYYGTGDHQFGMRHALDFEPYLIALMLLALAPKAPRILAIATALTTLFSALLLLRYELLYEWW